MLELTPEIAEDIRRELVRMEHSWGEQNHPHPFWLCILGEEFGEAAQSIVERDIENLYRELVQVAAISIVWLGMMRRNGEACR